jgi:beta-galactosidase
MNRIIYTLLLVLAFLSWKSQSQTHTFQIGDGQFLLDGKPFQIISGEMHFARIPQEYWRDRLKTAKAMGLNTIATYVFWNYHEPEKGIYHFSGNADVAKFVKTAQEEGLWVIIRPSPYACAEWEFGGYPYWLLKEDSLKVRSRDPRFLEMSWRYMKALAKEVYKLQITNGGPIILFQVENEYGSYDKDKEYLAIQRDIYRDAGINVELYTCDGPSQMPNGYLPGTFPAVNGLDNVQEVKELIDKHNNGKGPYFIAEWYPGWFDSWGLKHHTVPHAECTGILDTVLMNGFSINFYMAHGGTTFGFMNGANTFAKGAYRPQLTSYDYDAPIDEAGNPTEKYIAFRNVIQKYLPKGQVLPPVPEKKKTMKLSSIRLNESADPWKQLPSPVPGETPYTFEDLNQAYGYVIYRTLLTNQSSGWLKIDKLRDFGIVMVNGKVVSVLDRRLWQDSVFLEVPDGEATLDIFVENLGRINYGPYLNDNHKGITQQVLLNGKELKGWQMFCLPFSNPSLLTFTKSGKATNPIVRRGTFKVNEALDTYLDMRKWGKGVVWVNGHHLGRYWNVGPQQTLYLPGCWLKPGENEIIVFEELVYDQNKIITTEVPIIDDLIEPLK